jgi:hypothetical protein
VWWHARAALNTPAVAEPRAELALALQETWRSEQGTPLRWVSGTRALAASAAFYAGDHPHYWSLWNLTIETPWVDAGQVSRDGAMIVCELDDNACQNLAASWTDDQRTLRVSKAARGFQFEPRDYRVYLLAPELTDGS